MCPVETTGPLLSSKPSNGQRKQHQNVGMCVLDRANHSNPRAAARVDTLADLPTAEPRMKLDRLAVAGPHWKLACDPHEG